VPPSPLAAYDTLARTSGRRWLFVYLTLVSEVSMSFRARRRSARAFRAARHGGVEVERHGAHGW